MKTQKILHSLVVPMALGLLSITGVSARAADYHFLKEIPIGGAGGFDYLSVDPDGRRLYVSHGTKAVVIDIDNDAIVGEIADTPGIHGIAIAPEIGRVFTSNGREARAGIVDIKTLQTLSKVETGQNPDAILYDPGQQEVYTFNGRASSATVIDAKTGKVVATIPLGGKPEFATVDPATGHIFNNLENKSEVTVIDTKTHQVINTWPIAPGEEPSGMAIDVPHHRIFVGCGGGEKQVMEMIDNTNGKVLATVPIDDGVDANAFDPGTQLAFASCGSGTVTIAHEDSPDKLTVVQKLTTQRGARTMALDPKTNRIYLSVGSGDSFKVLVYGM
jgi:YVTN family beta-propeller protein